jgi:hypothetical protein
MQGCAHGQVRDTAKAAFAVMCQMVQFVISDVYGLLHFTPACQHQRDLIRESPFRPSSPG